MSDTVYSEPDKQRAFDLVMLVIDKHVQNKEPVFIGLTRDEKIQLFAKLYHNSLELLARPSVHTDTASQHQA